MSSSEIKLSRIALDNIELLSQVSKNTFIESYQDFNSTESITCYIDDNFNTGALTQQLINPNSYFYVLFLGEQAIGYLKLNFDDAQTEQSHANTLEIERIYVLKALQGNRYGALLLDKAIEIFKSKQHDYIWLGVWENNHNAIAFYKNKGFNKFDEHTFNFGGEIQTDWLMKLDS
jgi:ribosomal protein S18 acetylase RimI-like enzyme